MTILMVTLLQAEVDPLGHAWEGAGGARASLFNALPFLELRGVTDTANHEAPADFHHNVRGVMTNLAAFIVSWRTQT